MEELNHKPVIIASSLTGLLISHALSKAHIPHILIGGEEPDQKPRLGESMNGGATVHCWRFLEPEFQRFFYVKNHVSIFNGKTVFMLYFDNPNRDLSKFPLREAKAGYMTTLKGFVQLDRSKFDPVFYRKVKSSQYCTFIHNTKSKIIYDSSTDKVTAIYLDDEHQISNPTYVFDATGHVGVVAQAAGVEKRSISRRQRVVWTHHYRESTQKLPKTWWFYGTNSLRLIKEIDGVDGTAWLITLGNSLSLGLSVDALVYPVEKISKEALIKILDDAFARRGVAYHQYFTKTKPITELNQEYFVRSRAYGQNWLLAGSSYIQIWFPSSTGVASGMLAAVMAPKFLQDPEGAGRYYTESEAPLLELHTLLDDMINGQPFTKKHEAYQFLTLWFPHYLISMLRHYRASNDEIDSFRLLKYDFPETLMKSTEKSLPLWLSYTGEFMAVEKFANLADQGKAFNGYFNFPVLKIKNNILSHLRLFLPQHFP